jgi:Tfp pilus assembly protein PilV
MKKTPHSLPGSGFSLIETVLLITLTGIAATALLSLNSSIRASFERIFASDTQIQSASFAQQQCAEFIIQRHRAATLSRTTSGTTWSCPSGSAATVSSAIISASADPGAGAVCPPNVTCQELVISATGVPNIVLVLSLYDL